MFQILDATKENDFEDTIEVSLIGTEMVVEPEDGSDHERATAIWCILVAFTRYQNAAIRK